MTGRLVRPTARMKPSRPAVWSEWPWLSTMASMLPRSTPRARMFETSPSGLSPASNSSRWVLPPAVTVIRAAKPCSAIRPSRVQSSSNTADGRRRASPMNGRIAGPWFTASMSVTLSMRVVMTMPSTGSSGMVSRGSVSSLTAATGTGSTLPAVSHMTSA